MEQQEFRSPISPSEFVTDPSGEEADRMDYGDDGITDLNNMDDDDGSSLDLNDLDDEYDSEDSEDCEELLFEHRAIEFSREMIVEEEFGNDDDEEALNDCQIYIEEFDKSYTCSEEDIRHFYEGKTKTQIEDELSRLEKRLEKLKETANGNFKGLDTTLQDIFTHRLALQEWDSQVLKQKKRADATLNKNTRPNRKRKSVPINDDENDENEDDDFIDDSEVPIQQEDDDLESGDEELVIKQVLLNEEEQKLAKSIEECIVKKDNIKFREYLRMYARREMPIAVAVATKLVYHFRNQEYEEKFRKNERAKQLVLRREKLAAEQEQQHQKEAEEVVNESVAFVKKKHGNYLLEYQDYVMDHQIDCLEKAINRMMNGKSLLIAHSMGLGKTLTVLLILKNYNRIFSQGKIAKSLKYLVLVPKSNIEHFSKQYAYHFPNGGFLSAIIVIDDKKAIHEKIHEFNSGGRMLVMTYERCKKILQHPDFEDVATDLKKADILVIDEAHIIKNPDTEMFKRFSEFTNSLKLLVSGTPLQNNISEIYTLIRFLEPKNPHVERLKYCFNTTFKEFFDANRTNLDNREVLARVQVFYQFFEDLIHRKVNIKEMEEIANKKEDIIIEYNMGKEEKDIYDYITKQYKTKCYFARYFYQRLCLDCVEYLKDLTDETECEKFSQNYNFQDEKIESFVTTLKTYINGKYPKNLKSTRVSILCTLARTIVERSEKVVIFSGLVCYYDSIQKRLSDKNKVGVFTGETSSANRALIIDQFNKGIINTLLISKNAGGVGIDLTTATNVILFNLDFNFAKDDQAICRLVRKNQKNQVKIFRLVCRESVDMAVKTLQAHKTVIFDKLLDDIAATIKVSGKDTIPEDLCRLAFKEKTVPATVKKHIVNIEKFKLTESSKVLEDYEVVNAKENIEEAIGKGSKFR